MAGALCYSPPAWSWVTYLRVVSELPSMSLFPLPVGYHLLLEDHTESVSPFILHMLGPNVLL